MTKNKMATFTAAHTTLADIDTLFITIRMVQIVLPDDLPDEAWAAAEWYFYDHCKLPHGNIALYHEENMPRVTCDVEPLRDECVPIERLPWRIQE